MNRHATVASLALATIVALTGCGADGAPDATGSPGAVGGLGSAPAGGSASANPSKPAVRPTDAAGPGTKSPTPSGPHIVYFRIKQRPKCPAGTTVSQTPAEPLIIEWKVTGVPRVTLSVDGPGIYNTYDAEGNETFMFSCGGPPGTTEKHTYLLRTVGADVERSKSIAATATVNEIVPV